jgi:hypothetical protein
MPKNKIQFQKGLSLQRFYQLYGTEHSAIANDTKLNILPDRVTSITDD